MTANLDRVLASVAAFDRRWPELATEAAAWKRGTLLSGWCVGHYRRDGGLIVEIEQHVSM